MSINFDYDIVSCKDCPLWEKSTCGYSGILCRVAGMQGKGPKIAKVMVIGEAPGGQEIIKNEPFTGDAGNLLNDFLREVGLNREEFYITNVVKCRPPNNRTPSKKEIRDCLPKLITEIEEVKPQIIVLLGAVPLSAVLQINKGITKLTGKAIWSDRFDAVCVPIVHPAYVLRNQTEYAVNLFRKGWQVIKQLIEKGVCGKEDIKVKEQDYKYCVDLTSVQELFALLQDQKEVAYDSETTGFDYFKDNILCMSFSWAEGKGAVLPFYHSNPNYMEDKKLDPFWDETAFSFIIRMLRECFGQGLFGDVMIAQNGKFDNKFLLRRNINPKNFKFDTMLAHHLLNEEGDHGLTELALEYTDLGDYEKDIKQFLPNSKTSYAVIPESNLWEYACKDTDATFRLYKIFSKKLKEEGLETLFYKIVMPYCNLLAKMEMYGLKIDQQQLSSLIKTYGDKIEEKTKGLRDLESVKNTEQLLGKEFNPRSVQHVRCLLYGDPKDNRSTDSKTLEALEGKNEGATYLSELRKLTKFYGTYLKNIPDLVCPDGRLRTTYMQHRTRTGRLSSVKPNFQNQPKRGEEAKDIRSYFVAEEKHLLVEADFKQAEFRCWAQYSQDERMIKDIESGIDIHKEMSVILFKKSIEDVTEYDRFIAKMTVFGVMYGRGPRSVAEEFGITEIAAKRTIRAFLDRYPKAEHWLNEAKKFAVTNGYVVNYFGRKRRVPLIKGLKVMYTGSTGQLMFDVKTNQEAHSINQAVNAPIQSFAHECLSITALRIDKVFTEKGLKAKILMDIHDALLFEIPEIELKDSVTILKEQMEKPIAGMTVPMKVDIKVGRRWSEMADYDVT